MDFGGFDWDAGNREKCRKHGLSMEDIESVFDGPVVIIHDAGNSILERRFRAIGRTLEGRHAFVAFTWRGDKIRPISARYMHRKEVAAHEKANPEFPDR